MRCGSCGRESSDSAIFCQSCGSRLGMPAYGAYASSIANIQQPPKDVRLPIALIILGVVIVAIGIVMYAWAMSDAVHDATNLNPNNPFGSFDNVVNDVGNIWGSYAIIGIGSLMILVGFIILIIKLI